MEGVLGYQQLNLVCYNASIDELLITRKVIYWGLNTAAELKLCECFAEFGGYFLTLNIHTHALKKQKHVLFGYFELSFYTNMLPTNCRLL